MFSFIVIVGVVGNIIVLWIVLGHKQFWNSTNWFLVNLSSVDLLMNVFNIPFNFVFMMER